MGTFFQAWRRRQAEQQAAEWTQEQEEARHAVEELPDVLREQARRAVDTLLEGRDEEVAGALEDLDHLLEAHPDLRDQFFRLRVVDDAVQFLDPGHGASR
jgi:molecular chaperone DnaK (HSP70)